MGDLRLAILDPSGRLVAELGDAAREAGVTLVPVARREAAELPSPDVAGAPAAALVIAPLVAGELGPAPSGAPPRWIAGDGANPSRVAGAAAQATALGVLLTPVAAPALAAIARAAAPAAAIAGGEAPSARRADLERARGLIATSLVDLTGAARDALGAVAARFSADDCIVWWRDGAQLTPAGARVLTDAYRVEAAAAARIAAAAAGTTLTPGPAPRAVMADALRASPTEVAGLVAIVADAPRMFTAAERSDLRAIATRLTRELSWLATHRRLVAEGERLLAASLHDPMTGAMARAAFEQTIAHEAAAAIRHGERLTLAVLDVVGLRRINLAHGHRAGDEVLTQLAARLRATVRGNDAIGRLGGDELAVLLIGAAASDAEVVIGKLSARLDREPIRAEGAELAVTLRGVATELSAGERSGEAALARCYAHLRATPAGQVRVVPPDARVTEDSGAESSLSAGTVVGGSYRVLHELSRGAMGVVYRGEDLGLGRAVAIKVLRSDLASDRDLVARFRAEAGLLASLHHPNLVQVFALGEHSGDVYFAMELVEGQPLSEVLRATIERRDVLPGAAVAQIALEIGDALDAMHERGLIHRDVKPANILLDRERDRAVLVDVGVAVKAGAQRDAAGTPGFAAPESFLERTDGPTADVYGLAATVYSMLTGRPPFGSGPAPQVVQRQLHDPLVPPSQLRPGLSEAVDAVLAKALHPLPKKRWASASTFAIALGRALERLPAVLPERRAPVTEDPVRAVEFLLAPTSGLDAPGGAAAARAASGGATELAPPPGRAPSAPGAGRSPTGPAGHVRAAHLRVLSRLLQHHLGESGMAQLVEQAPALAAALTPTLAPLAWVPLADLVGALERARAMVPSQLVPRTVGRGTMSATFARLYGANPASLPTETVLAALPSFWPRFHAWGDAAADAAATRARVRLAGDPGSTDVCALVAAELERIAELTGAEAVTATHARCARAGDPACEFELTWLAPRAPFG